MSKIELLEGPATNAIIGAFFDVYNEPGKATRIEVGSSCILDRKQSFSEWQVQHTRQLNQLEFAQSASIRDTTVANLGRAP